MVSSRLLYSLFSSSSYFQLLCPSINYVPAFFLSWPDNVCYLVRQCIYFPSFAVFKQPKQEAEVKEEEGECCFVFSHTLFHKKMRGVLVLLLACSISLQNEQPDQGFDEYIPIIRVLCGEDEMTVQIDTAFERVHAFITATGARRLSTANITLGDGCLLVEDRPNNAYTVTSPYSGCGIEEKNLDYGKRYFSWLNIGTTDKYSVSCSFPKSMPKLTGTRFEVSNRYEHIDTRREFVPSVLNDQLSIVISPTFASMAREFPEIYSYPSKCTISNWKGEENPVTILENGCPVFDERKRFFLSAIFQPNAQSLLAEETEIRVVMNTHIMPSGRGAFNPDFKFGCDVFFCTAENKHRIKNIPLCPSAAHCNGLGGKQPILKRMGGDKLVPAHLEIPIRVDLSRTGGFGPIREPIPSIFNVNMTRPQIQCAESPSYTMYIITSIICVVLGFFTALAFLRFTAPGHYCLNATRCGSEITQADPAPQPYVKLESQASGALIMPDSPALA